MVDKQNIAVLTPKGHPELVSEYTSRYNEARDILAAGGNEVILADVIDIASGERKLVAVVKDEASDDVLPVAEIFLADGVDYSKRYKLVDE